MQESPGTDGPVAFVLRGDVDDACLLQAVAEAADDAERRVEHEAHVMVLGERGAGCRGIGRVVAVVGVEAVLDRCELATVETARIVESANQSLRDGLLTRGL